VSLVRLRSLKGIFGRVLGIFAPQRPSGESVPVGDDDAVRTVVARMAGGLAHDLNNILLILQGYEEMAGEEPDATAMEELLTAMRHAIDRAGQLVGDLLLVGERGPFTPRLLDLSEIIRRRLPRIAADSPGGIEIRSSLGQGLHPVMADEDLVARLLEALCVRACEAMPAGGVLTISIERGPAAGPFPVVLRVRDTGVTLTDDMRLRLFDPYLPGPSGGKGLGLRLTAASAAVRRLGGQIRVRSGEGTDIEVAFPAGIAPANEPAPARPAKTGTDQRGIILVAEDDESLRSSAEKILTREGYGVRTARDGQEAIEIIEHDGQTIRLVLLDEVMPRMGGRAALIRIREILPGLPVILCSGYAWQFDGSSPARAEDCETLRKPWQPRELLQKVRECLEPQR
jgi:two-component system, cell cycle sensor histidine kinase and response regulator CckA